MSDWCVCGHAKVLHPFGLSEAMVFDGGCLFRGQRCDCAQFTAVDEAFAVDARLTEVDEGKACGSADDRSSSSSVPAAAREGGR